MNTKTTSGPIGIPTGDMRVGVVEPAQGGAEEPGRKGEVRPDRPDLFKNQEPGGCLTLATTPTSCRWCGKKFDLVFGRDEICPHCGAPQSEAFRVTTTSSQRSIILWHNPDNSLFIEFEQPGGKTSRYILSPEKLLELGLLELYDQPTKGRRKS